jgi:hypothetical protein
MPTRTYTLYFIEKIPHPIEQQNVLSFSFLICATKDFVDIGTATNDKL